MDFVVMSVRVAYLPAMAGAAVNIIQSATANSLFILHRKAFQKEIILYDTAKLRIF